MHKLDRTADGPPCLDNYACPPDKWDAPADPSPAARHAWFECKRSVRKALKEMQGNFCAYCESELWGDAHIEHFRRKNPDHYPELTFHWPNLFWSCQSHDHCGHFKDRPSGPSYSADDLIKPDEEDPDQFFYLYSSGEIRLRSGLDAEQERRAKATIEAFGLDDPGLCGERATKLAKYRKKNKPDLDELMAWSEDERTAYLEFELAAVRNEAFSTTIKHFLERQ
jgi:uncharacterized protein (TIGR02646 family)